MKKHEAPLLRTLPPLQHLKPTTPNPYWKLTFLCGGREFRFAVRARNAQAAAAEGLIELAAQYHEFNPENARLVATLQSL